MAINLHFDENYNIEDFSFFLAGKNLKAISPISTFEKDSVAYKRNMKGANELSLTVHRIVYRDDKTIECENWDKIKDLAVLYVPELDEYFEMSINHNIETDNLKTITGTALCESELANLEASEIEINTESDILRDEYELPTIFCDKSKPERSLLHRVLSQAPHYTVGHVDDSLCKIQRTFTFGSDIASAFNNIAEEVNCIFTYTIEDGVRTVNAYDLYPTCKDCGHRDNFEGNCPKCGSTNIARPYGSDTGIYIDNENLATSIQMSSNTDEIKNCFKLKAGDDMMTAAVRQINPNNSDYVYYFTEELLDDMPDELSDNIKTYNELYDQYMNHMTYIVGDTSLCNKYKQLCIKYNDSKYASYKYNDDDEKVLTNNSFSDGSDMSNYTKLINTLYDNIDFQLYLESNLMPTVKDEEIDVKKEILKFTSSSLSPVGCENFSKNTSSATAETLVKNYAKVLLDSGYSLDATTTSYTYSTTPDSEGNEYGTWIGTITISVGIGDDKTYATSGSLTVKITGNYEYFIKQKIIKSIKSKNEEYGGILNIFEIEEDSDFVEALKYYGSARLDSFNDAYQSALDILIEMDQASEGADFYEAIYVPYYNRKQLINNEKKLRDSEVGICSKFGDALNLIVDTTRDALDFPKYLGHDLWVLFNSYRRDGVYENSNYVSEGLSNADLTNKAHEFYTEANKKIYENAHGVKSFTTSLNNLLELPEFKPLIDSFEVGNWIRIGFEDGIYKLRLLSYQINFASMDSIDVEFSTTSKQLGQLDAVKNAINVATKLENDYSNISQNAKEGAASKTILNNWKQNGLDVTQQEIVNNAKEQTVVYDSNGLLVRSYDDVLDDYSPEQVKMINSTIAFTDNNWLSVKTALGKISYTDPITGEVQTVYGLNANTVVGDLILGDKLGIYNSSSNSSMSFNGDGLVINAMGDSLGKYRKLFALQRDGKDILSIDETGHLKMDWSSVNKLTVDDIENVNTLRGSVWYTGTAINGTSTTPTSYPTGITMAYKNDMYLNTTNGYTYKCTTEGNAAKAKWIYDATIKGKDGANGTDGKDNISIGATPPEDKNKLWCDTSVEPAIMKRWNPKTNKWETVNDYSNDITKLNEKVTKTEEHTANLEADIDGFKQTVSDTYAEKTELTDLEGNLEKNYSTKTEMDSAINQKADEISLTVSKLEEKVDNIDTTLYRANLIASGTFLNSINNSITLNCQVLNGTTDITEKQADIQFQWYKNNAAFKKGKSISVTKSDVEVSANFKCIATVDAIELDTGNTTIIDESDVANLGNSYLDVTGVQLVQTLNTDDTYSPDWDSQNAKITPSILDGFLSVELSSCAISYKKIVNNSEVALGSGETVSNGILTINKNIMTKTNPTVTYVCYVTYKSTSIKLFATFTLNIVGQSGGQGSDGTSLVSMTPEFYLSTSKTAQIGSSWTTVQPEWSSGKYLWKRYKQVYKNPTKTEYTTPEVDTSWEAVNEIDVGTRNLLQGTKDFKYGLGSGAKISETYLGFIVAYKDNSAGTDYTDVVNWRSVIDVEPNTEYTLSFYAKGTGNCCSHFYPTNVASGISSEGKSTAIEDGNITYTLTSSWKRYWITWKTLSTATGKKHVIPMRLLKGAKGYICGIMFTKGNKDVDWSPAPEDLDQIHTGTTAPSDKTMLWLDTNDNLLKYWDGTSWEVANDFAEDINNAKQTITTEYNSAINQLKESLTILVEKLQTTTTDNATLIEQLSSQIVQNASSISLITNSVNSINDNISGLATKEEISQWARFQGGVLELGASNSPFAVKLSNTELGFYQNGSRIAYLSNQQLNIEFAIVMTKLNIGIFSWSYDSVNGLTLT